MTRQVRHPLVDRDVYEILDHILETTGGDFGAAARRLDQIDALLASIAANPSSGVRLGGASAGWLARHGGRDRMITVVFRPDPARNAVLIALVAFGARDWLAVSENRSGFQSR